MLVTTFSSSKGGTGKTTLAVSLSVLSSASARTLLVDASAEGGATSYLLGDAPGPYFWEDPEGSLRSVELSDGVALTVAVNRGPLVDPARVAQALEAWRETFDFTVVDLPALTDVDTVERYMPLLRATNAVLVVVEPNPASLEAALYCFGGKRVVVALNCPRPYPATVVDWYRRAVEVFCRKFGYEYAVIPYDPALSRLAPTRLRALQYTSEALDTALFKLLMLLRERNK